MTSLATGLKSSVRGDVTVDFLTTGGALPNLHRHEVPLAPPVDLDALHAVMSEGVKRYAAGAFKKDYDFDAWLAPRVHYCLRLTKRQAAAPELWLRLALVEFSDYVRLRWKDDEKPAPRYRYTGEGQFLRRNALSRLWWAAENARNGSDYKPVGSALSSSGYDQYILDLRYSHYRPAVIALLDALHAKPLDFKQMSKLSIILNVALGSRCLESMGGPWLEGEDMQWLSEDVDGNHAIQAGVADLKGPDTPKVDAATCKPLRDWFGALIAQLASA